MICRCYGQDPRCPECGGFGITHCCEGLQAQPEAAQWGEETSDRIPMPEEIEATQRAPSAF